MHNRNLPQHTYFERQNAPKRVRDEKEVKEAKASSPKERLRVRRKDSEEREMQKVSEKGQRGGAEKRWGWGRLQNDRVLERLIGG